jgi:hypothetical protein
VEVKTTDTYRIDLDTLAGYRRALIQGGSITEERASLLIVVGREDTGDLEAPIRGLWHAWDMRLISVDALMRLGGGHPKREHSLALVFLRAGGSLSTAAALQEATPPPPCAYISSGGRSWGERGKSSGLNPE